MNIFKRKPQEYFIQMTDEDAGEVRKLIVDPSNTLSLVEYFKAMRNIANANGVFCDYRKEWEIKMDWFTNCLRLKEKK